MKRLLAPLSIVNQVALLMLLSGILGVAGMGISAWMSQSIQGQCARHQQGRLAAYAKLPAAGAGAAG